MNWLIVEYGIVTNIITADQEFANEIGAMPYYDGAVISQPYSPPQPPPTTDQLIGQQLTDMQLTSIAQGQRQTALELATIEQGQKITDVELEALKNV